MKHCPLAATGFLNQEAAMKPEHLKILVQSSCKIFGCFKWKKIIARIIFTLTALHRGLKNGANEAERSVDQALTKWIAIAGKEYVRKRHYHECHEKKPRLELDPPPIRELHHPVKESIHHILFFERNLTPFASRKTLHHCQKFGHKLFIRDWLFDDSLSGLSLGGGVSLLLAGHLHKPMEILVS